MALTDTLRHLIWKKHGLKAQYLKSEQIVQSSQRDVVRGGVVHVYQLKHADYLYCYGWRLVADDNSDDVSNYAIVLGKYPVTSSQSAVRAYLARQVN